MSDELPEPWGSALSGKGIHSYGDLAAAIGGSKSKAHRLVTGGGTSNATIQAVADKFFGGDADRVHELLGSTRKSYGPWTPPDAVHLLTPKQRRALEVVIAAMTPEEASNVVPIKRTASRPATKVARKPGRPPSNKTTE